MVSQDLGTEKPPYSNLLHPKSREDDLTSIPKEECTDLHRALSPRQISMIAIGGAIGTGLIIGTGAALAKAGPAPTFIAYLIVGFIVYLVMCAVGEMASWLPLQSGFTGYAARFVDPSLGFATGYVYWLKYCIAAPNQLTAAALCIQYWVPRERVNPGVFIAVFLVLITAVNYLGVKWFGELEFWLSAMKVLTLVGLILLCLVLVSGGGPSGEAIGFKYWKNPGAFNTSYAPGDAGRFLAVCSAFINATFAYLGCEIVGVTVGEAKDPRRTIPKAIKLTMWRIVAFYIVLVLLIGMLVPYNSKQLAFAINAGKSGTSALASPFAVAAAEQGIRSLPGIINGCILIFVISASNSDFYISSRTLYSLAKEGHAPAVFAKTNSRGVPLLSLGVSVVFALIAFMNCAEDSKAVFGYLVSAITIFGLLIWISLLISHIGFVHGRKAQGIDVKRMPYVARFGTAGSYFALSLCVIIVFMKNFDVFIHDSKRKGMEKFDHKTFIAGYIGIPVYLALIFGHKMWKRTHHVKRLEMDLHTGGEIVQGVYDEEGRPVALNAEESSSGDEFEKPILKKGSPKWIYRRFIAWLF